MSAGYVIQPSPEPDDIGMIEVIDEIRERGYAPYLDGESMSPAMEAGHLTVCMQVGLEHLATLGGAQPGDVVSSDAVNRGLLAYLRGRDRFGTGRR